MKVIEINGIKLEVDERTAITIEQYKVGDKVKILVKSYGEVYKVHPGVIVGFSDFKNLPTIEVMYLDIGSYGDQGFKFAFINDKNKENEICPFNELEAILDKDSILEGLNKMVEKKEAELNEIKLKREYFIKRFAILFHDVKL